MNWCFCLRRYPIAAVSQLAAIQVWSILHRREDGEPRLGFCWISDIMHIRCQETFGEYGFKRNFRWTGVDGSGNGLTISVRNFLDSSLIGFALGFGQDIYILVWMVRMMHFWIHLCFSLAVSKDAISVRSYLGSSYTGFALGSGISLDFVHGYAVECLPHRKGVWKYATAGCRYLVIWYCDVAFCDCIVTGSCACLFSSWNFYDLHGWDETLSFFETFEKANVELKRFGKALWPHIGICAFGRETLARRSRLSKLKRQLSTR